MCLRTILKYGSRRQRLFPHAKTLRFFKTLTCYISVTAADIYFKLVQID